MRLWEVGAPYTGPKALRQMPSEVLPTFCLALKQYMAKECAGQGALGHATSAVELALALHRVFKVPYEPILFEGEALALPHKLLVGQKPGWMSKRMSPPEGLCETGGPLVLAKARALLEARKLSGHPGKVAVVLEEKRPVHKDSFEALSQAGAADMPWVLVLARAEGVEGAEAFLPRVALASFFGSLGFGLWPTVEATHIAEVERALRQAKLARKTTMVHIRLSGGGFHEGGLQPPSLD